MATTSPTEDQAARALLSALYPIFAAGAISAVFVPAGEPPRASFPLTWVPAIVRPRDSLAHASQKLGQALGFATGDSGAFRGA